MRHLYEFFNTAAIQLPQPIEISEQDKAKLKKMKWSDIKVLDPKESGDLFTMRFKLPVNVSDGIVFQLQPRENGLYKLQNIDIHKDLQGLGLGTKLYRAVLEEFGQLYSPKSGRHNELQVPKIHKALAKDSKIDMFKKGSDVLLLHKGNPDYDEIKSAFLGKYFF